MSQSELLDRTQQAVANDEVQIVRQRAIISWLEEEGRDASAARTLLNVLLMEQVKHRQELATAVREFLQ